MNGTYPIGKVSVGQGIDCGGRSNDVDFVVTIKVPTDFEGSKVGEGFDAGYFDGVVVLGK